MTPHWVLLGSVRYWGVFLSDGGSAAGALRYVWTLYWRITGNMFPLLSKSAVVVRSVVYLYPGNVSICHGFALNLKNPIYSIVRGIPPNHHKSFQEEARNMFAARIIVPSVSIWSFQIFIEVHILLIRCSACTAAILIVTGGPIAGLYQTLRRYFMTIKEAQFLQH